MGQGTTTRRAAYAQRRGQSGFNAIHRGTLSATCEAHGSLGKAPPVTGFVSGREKGSKVVSKVVPKVRSVTRLGPPPRHFINYKSFPQTKDESCTHPELKRLQGS